MILYSIRIHEYMMQEKKLKDNKEESNENHPYLINSMTFNGKQAFMTVIIIEYVRRTTEIHVRNTDNDKYRNSVIMSCLLGFDNVTTGLFS